MKGGQAVYEGTYHFMEQPVEGVLPRIQADDGTNETYGLAGIGPNSRIRWIEEH